jgi:hypothetical protein
MMHRAKAQGLGGLEGHRQSWKVSRQGRPCGFVRSSKTHLRVKLWLVPDEHLPQYLELQQEKCLASLVNLGHGGTVPP